MWKEKYGQLQVWENFEKDSVAEILGLEYPFIDPTGTVLPASFTDKLLQRIIYLHCFFLLSSHPLQSIFQTVYYTLAEATNFHVGKSKEHSSDLRLFSFSAISGGQSFFLRTISFLGFYVITLKKKPKKKRHGMT